MNARLSVSTELPVPVGMTPGKTWREIRAAPSRGEAEGQAAGEGRRVPALGGSAARRRLAALWPGACCGPERWRCARAPCRRSAASSGPAAASPAYRLHLKREAPGCFCSPAGEGRELGSSGLGCKQLTPVPPSVCPGRADSGRLRLDPARRSGGALQAP